jgi:hypothetical protein
MEQMQEVLGNIGNGKQRAKLPNDLEIAVMGKEGDVKTIWNPQNAAEVDNARATFANMRAKGYAAFRVAANGEQGEQITEFDPTAGKMILMVPALQGG